MPKKYIVRLTPEERAQLETLTTSGKGAARMHTHARILLKADVSAQGPAWTDEAISHALEVSIPTIERVRRLLVLEGLDAALQRKAPPPRPRKLDGHLEAHLVTLACSQPPEGHARWTLRLLRERFVALEAVPLAHIGRETVRQVLKKTPSNPG